MSVLPTITKQSISLAVEIPTSSRPGVVIEKERVKCTITFSNVLPDPIVIPWVLLMVIGMHTRMDMVVTEQQFIFYLWIDIGIGIPLDSLSGK